MLHSRLFAVDLSHISSPFARRIVSPWVQVTHLLCGSLLPVWSELTVAIDKVADERTTPLGKIYKVRPQIRVVHVETTSESLLGISLPSAKARLILDHLRTTYRATLRNDDVAAPISAAAKQDTAQPAAQPDAHVGAAYTWPSAHSIYDGDINHRDRRADDEEDGASDAAALVPRAWYM